MGKKGPAVQRADDVPFTGEHVFKVKKKKKCIHIYYTYIYVFNLTKSFSSLKRWYS